MAGVPLKDKFKGCIAGSWIGSAMGAPVEGWTPERIQREHGLLDELLPYVHYPDRTPARWYRPPGTTEDGIERQRLLATAIIEKSDRILARDLVAVWLRDITPERAVFKQEEYDLALLELARAGVPAEVLGQMRGLVGNVGAARSSHPVGLINAGDPRSAADDVFEVGQVYFPRSSPALRWAAIYCAAIAEACKSDATVESVIETAQEFALYRAEKGRLFAGYDRISSELARAVKIAQESEDMLQLRGMFYEHYHGGEFMTYGASQANEVVCKGLAVFMHTKGSVKDSIVASVNFGRDTDCLAAIAGGLAGTLSGTAEIPSRWISQVDKATEDDNYTNTIRSIADTAEGLYDAFASRIARLQAYTQMMKPDVT